jgi:hypothetical protein
MKTKIDFEAMRKRCDRDPSLAVFMVRDTEEVARAGLLDLAWCLCYDCHKNDALGFFEDLENFLASEEHEEAERDDADFERQQSIDSGELIP